MLKILFVTSEVYPLIKTGGLADASSGLAIALKSLRCDIRLLLPAYQAVIDNLSRVKRLCSLSVPELAITVNLLEATLPHRRLKVWLVDYPTYYARPGNPYIASDGQAWPDNAQRFALLSLAAKSLAIGKLAWKPDLVHCNDWQTALTPALLSIEKERPVTVFTIHNLAYQGLFSYETFKSLNLPKQFSI